MRVCAQPDLTEHSIYERNCNSVHNPLIEPKVRSYILLLDVGVAFTNTEVQFHRGCFELVEFRFYIIYYSVPIGLQLERG